MERLLYVRDGADCRVIYSNGTDTYDYPCDGSELFPILSDRDTAERYLLFVRDGAEAGTIDSNEFAERETKRNEPSESDEDGFTDTVMLRQGEEVLAEISWY